MPWWWCYAVRNDPEATGGFYGIAGFYFSTVVSRSNTYVSRMFTVPYWFVTSALLILPLRFVILARKQMRIGHCPKCGYSLTDNSSGTCPECGTPVAGKAGT